jgi:hypothetical protein
MIAFLCTLQLAISYANSEGKMVHLDVCAQALYQRITKASAGRSPIAKCKSKEDKAGASATRAAAHRKCTGLTTQSRQPDNNQPRKRGRPSRKSGKVDRADEEG